ncbi:MAG: glycoside hydrolase family 97 N-terminal domain-containing protein, partial [Proteiniphilum sp.]|nr:glycoside hydrolase family 97 N-terminal domain-containing protein [Proteiniphilum sp.]
MKHLFLILSILFTFTTHMFAQIATLTSPDGKLNLQFHVVEGQPQYSVEYEGKTILEQSPLGIVTNE